MNYKSLSIAIILIICFSSCQQEVGKKKEESVLISENNKLYFNLEGSWYKKTDGTPKWGIDVGESYIDSVSNATLSIEGYNALLTDFQVLKSELMKSRDVYIPNGNINYIKDSPSNQFNGYYLSSSSDTLQLLVYCGFSTNPNLILRITYKGQKVSESFFIDLVNSLSIKPTQQ